MTRLEALQILKLSAGASPDEIRRAYKARAFATHPDRGGRASDFLKVQAAYEVLQQSGGFNPPDAPELDSVLEQRLKEIRRAFDMLGDEATAEFDKTFETLGRDLVDTISNYSSHTELEKKIQKDITRLWEASVRRVCEFIELQLSWIGDQQEEWVQDYLRPVVEAARSLHPPRWYETKKFLAASTLLGFLFIGIAVYERNWRFALPAPIPLLIGVLFPLQYRKRFQPKRIIEGVHLSDVVRRVAAGRVNLETHWITSDDSSTIAGLIGVGLGALFLGPIGAWVGGTLLAFLGQFFGIGLNKRKIKIWEQLSPKFSDLISLLAKELDHRIEVTRDAMVQAVRANFKANVRTTVALLVGGTQSNRVRPRNRPKAKKSNFHAAKMAIGFGAALGVLPVVVLTSAWFNSGNTWLHSGKMAPVPKPITSGRMQAAIPSAAPAAIATAAPAATTESPNGTDETEVDSATPERSSSIGSTPTNETFEPENYVGGFAVSHGVGASMSQAGAQEFKPSFDCNSASGPVLSAICSSRELSSYDQTLAELYDEVEKKPSMAHTQKLVQRGWITIREHCGELESQQLQSCITSRYLERIARLQWLLNKEYLHGPAMPPGADSKTSSEP